jgi:hypothetical protein
MPQNQPHGSGPLSQSPIDPTPIFDMVRWSFGSELLAAASAYFDLFSLLAKKPMTLEEVGRELNIAPRSANVLVVALRAMKLLEADGAGKLFPTPIAREHLVPGGDFYMAGYVGLTSENPGVKNIVQRLRTGKPIESSPDDPGMGYMFRDGMESAMDHEASARRLTLALAGRARIVAPLVAQNYSLKGKSLLLDIGGGTGLYAIAFLRANPQLRAIVWDRAQVLKIAREMGEQFGVLDRLELRPGDMFADPVPQGCDVMLLSNILHDWDFPECHTLLSRVAAALPAGGELLIHDAFLNDELDGPLPVALYSAALFNITEGRAYSGKEYRQMLSAVGLKAGDAIPTAVNCAVMAGRKG